MLNLYRQIKAWKHLPWPGGLFDQPADLMERLNVVAVEVERWQQKRIDDAHGDAMKQQMLKGVDREHRR